MCAPSVGSKWAGGGGVVVVGLSSFVVAFGLLLATGRKGECGNGGVPKMDPLLCTGRGGAAQNAINAGRNTGRRR